MINKIIKAIACNIKANFENINVYTEEVKQGFKKPCFSIICVGSDSNIFLGKRHRMNVDIEIHYYNDKTRENYNDIMIQLFEILRYISIDSFPLRAVKTEMKVEDDWCCFKISYDFFYYIKDENTELMGEYMEKLNVINRR